MQSTAALPFGTICIIIVIWALVTFPLTVLGGIAGKNTKMEFNAPCRTTKWVTLRPLTAGPLHSAHSCVEFGAWLIRGVRSCSLLVLPQGGVARCPGCT